MVRLVDPVLTVYVDTKSPELDLGEANIDALCTR
jgi:hypothetical protein